LSITEKLECQTNMLMKLILCGGYTQYTIKYFIFYIMNSRTSIKFIYYFKFSNLT